MINLINNDQSGINHSRFLTDVLARVIPHLESLESCEEYLQKLGAKHQQYGVRIEHLDLLALVIISDLNYLLSQLSN